MVRPLRIEFPGAVYHVTSRGNARADIFEDVNDRHLFLSIFGQTVKRFNWLCHAYCLMGNHLLELCRYVVLNPVRAHMVERAEQYPWSSYLLTLGKAAVPEFLCSEWLLARFATTLVEARRCYLRFVLEGTGQQELPWDKLCGQVVLGTEMFVEQVVNCQ